MELVAYVSYVRVSTLRQGQSGLGIEAQRAAVARFVQERGGRLANEFVEVETGKGTNALALRPQLQAALAMAKKMKATLLIAKLDRLYRNVHFISGLMESRVRFIACDMPEADEFMLHVNATFAQYEAKRISERTKEALAAAKLRGVKLGTAGHANLKPNVEARVAAAEQFALRMSGVVQGMRGRQLTQRQMVAELNNLQLPAASGGQWSLTQMQRLLARVPVQRHPS